jgi:isopropylmalate/homocitrate/citramalate synthase
LDDAIVNAAFTSFKDLCDSKKVITDGDLHAIVRDALQV